MQLEINQVVPFIYQGQHIEGYIANIECLDSSTHGCQAFTRIKFDKPLFDSSERETSSVLVPLPPGQEQVFTINDLSNHLTHQYGRRSNGHR